MPGSRQSQTITLRLRFPGGSTAPRGARARIKVEDVSAADRASQVIAEQTADVGEDGSYSIDVPASAVESHASYSLFVHVSPDGSEQISSGDYISPAIIPVLTESSDEDVEVDLVRV